MIMKTRPELLKGSTYKLKFDHLTNALYVTINNKEVNGQLVPYEILLNCLDPSTLKWTPLLAKVISAMFRSYTDSEYVINELNELFESEPFFFKGKKYYSISQVIGELIKQHCELLNEENRAKANNKSMP